MWSSDQRRPTSGLVNALLGRARRRLTGERTAFVLSGGGNLGAVQVGMLRALAEADVVPDLIVGCSVGAINGAAFAAEPDLDGVERLDRIWRRIADGEPDLMPSRRFPLLAHMARRGESLHDAEPLAELLDDELPTRTFAGLRVPFQCVATDVDTATEHWFDTGRLVPALLASAALPVVYPAVELGSQTLIDGGVLNELHAARAAELGATTIYVLHVGHLEGRLVDVERPFDAAVRAYWTARRFRLEEDLRRIAEHCVVHRLPAGSNPRLRFDDFSRGAELADLAYDASAQYLRTGRAPVPRSGPVSAELPDEEAVDDDAETGSHWTDEAAALTAAALDLGPGRNGDDGSTEPEADTEAGSL
ncbi:MAG: patatin-like phospholipase family protein, partial [Actinomycetota bacterium]